MLGKRSRPQADRGKCCPARRLGKSPRQVFCQSTPCSLAAMLLADSSFLGPLPRHGGPSPIKRKYNSYLHMFRIRFLTHQPFQARILTKHMPARARCALPSRCFLPATMLPVTSSLCARRLRCLPAPTPSSRLRQRCRSVAPSCDGPSRSVIVRTPLGTRKPHARATRCRAALCRSACSDSF